MNVDRVIGFACGMVAAAGLIFFVLGMSRLLEELA